MRVSFLLCAYNEETTIRETIESILGQTVKPFEIVIVNDGSTDRTAEILKKYCDRCTAIHLAENTGNKAKAQMIGLEHVNGEIVAFTDADTTLDSRFLESSLPYFKDPSIGGVSGQVLSRRKNWLTGVRQIQYLIFQSLFKKGMSALDSILVIPGCAGLIRKKLFHPCFDTITEDMDITMTINEKGYRVVYAPEVKAYTEDPSNLRSYIRQTTRWYAGYFQNVKKHFRRSSTRMKLQTAMPIFDNITTILSMLLLLHSLFFSINPLFLSLFLVDLIIVEGYALYGAAKLSRDDLWSRIPGYFFVRAVDLFVWFKCLISELVLGRQESNWLRAKRTEI